MPQIKSSKKDLLRTARNRSRNVAVRSRLKTLTGQVLQARNLEEAQKAASDAIPELDRAATRGIVHPNYAARRKSVIAQAVSHFAQPKHA